MNPEPSTAEGVALKWRFIHRGLKARYRDQRKELRALVGALRPDDIAIDIGANKGSYLWSLSRAVPRGEVVAFEPQPALATYLRDVCHAARLSNVIVEAAGVSDTKGRRTLAIPGGAETSPGASFEVQARDGWRTVEVETHRLDDYFAAETRRIGAIKIDVEGHELAVLRGAIEILREHAPTIVCECEARHVADGDVGAVLRFFRDLSYDGFLVCRDRLLPASQFDPVIHQRAVGDKYWDAPGYFNNFIMTSTARASRGSA